MDDNFSSFDPYAVLLAHDEQIVKLEHQLNLQLKMYHELSKQHLALTELLISITNKITLLEKGLN
jgi:hypothetical protein